MVILYELNDTVWFPEADCRMGFTKIKILSAAVTNTEMVDYRTQRIEIEFMNGTKATTLNSKVYPSKRAAAQAVQRMVEQYLLED